MPTLRHTPEWVLLRDKLRERHSQGESWEALAASFQHPKVTRAHVHKMVVNNWEPRSNEVRERFGLSALKEIPAHLETYNPEVERVTLKPGQGSPRPPRIAIRKDNAESAANSIVANIERGIAYDIALAIYDELENPLNKKWYEETE